MLRGTRSAVPAAALTLCLAAAGCAGGSTTDPAADGVPGSTSSTAGAPTGSADSGPTGTGGTTTPGTTPGTAADPAPVEPGTALLDWQPVPGPTATSVTRSGDWSLSVDDAGTEAHLVGPSTVDSIRPDSGQQISDALIEGRYAVVVLQDRRESRPSTGRVFDLDHPEHPFTLDGSTDVPTTSGGTWALGQGRLLHATVHGRSYCVASVELATRTSTLGWCAPARHGFNGARITPSGQTLLTFDDSRPACRTAVQLRDAAAAPLPGVAHCAAWDSLLVPDGAVWSVVPDETRVESAHLYARQGGGYYDLGPGTSGSLTWCGDAAYFVRDPQHHGDPARLMRWRSRGGAPMLDAVYESPRGQAFLTVPRCGGTAITLTAFAEAGDRQVSADLG